MQLISNLESDYGKLTGFGFDEYHTLTETSFPTRYMRFAPYEDRVMEIFDDDCNKIFEKFKSEDIEYVIELNHGKRSRSAATQELLGVPEEIGKSWNRGKCATRIISGESGNRPVDSFKVKVQSIPLGGNFYVLEHYDIWKLKQ